MRDATVPSFGTLLRDGRKTKGWSQEEVEAQTGVSRATMSRLERELTDSPEPDHVRALCAALDIDPRQAAVSLGYLTLDEIQPVKPLPRRLQDILEILQDARLDQAEVDRWVSYMQFLRTKKDADSTSPAN